MDASSAASEGAIGRRRGPCGLPPPANRDKIGQNGIRGLRQPAAQLCNRDLAEQIRLQDERVGESPQARERVRLRQLDRAHGSLADTAVLDIGVQDTGPDGARWALAIRGVDVESLSGDVTIQIVNGETMIHTVSGDVQLGAARGDVEIETVSGDIDLRDVVAKQIRTHTTSGDVDFSGQILADGRYEYNTHSGEIRLALPADVGAQLNVATFNGGIESDFPITLKAGEHGILYGSVTTMDIAEALKEKGFDIDRRRISLREAIKETGDFTAQVRLHREITIDVPVTVTAEGASPAAAAPAATPPRAARPPAHRRSRRATRSARRTRSHRQRSRRRAGSPARRPSR